MTYFVFMVLKNVHIHVTTIQHASTLYDKENMVLNFLSVCLNYFSLVMVFYTSPFFIQISLSCIFKSLLEWCLLQPQQFVIS